VSKDYYEVLGLLHSAEDVVIKAAFKALAQRYHPDKFEGDPDVARAKMEDINEAYRVLSSPPHRLVHDRDIMGDSVRLDKTFADWVRAFVKARARGD